jgi:hypothetical protein
LFALGGLAFPGKANELIVGSSRKDVNVNVGNYLIRHDAV